MFDLSSKTKVNRKFRLTELYKMMQADKDIKADAKNIVSIVLTNVLSPDTMNIPSTGKVKEVYVLELQLSSRTIPALFISALDKAINLHTIFVLRYNSDSLLYGCYKEKTEKGVKLGKYYSTQWSSENILVKLPLSIASIEDIYTAIIDELIPITANQDEKTADFVERYDRITKLQKEIEKKQKQLGAETQSKRRFEINDELKALKKELNVLESPEEN